MNRRAFLQVLSLAATASALGGVIASETALKPVPEKTWVRGTTLYTGTVQQFNPGESGIVTLVPPMRMTFDRLITACDGPGFIITSLDVNQVSQLAEGNWHSDLFNYLAIHYMTLGATVAPEVEVNVGVENLDTKNTQRIQLMFLGTVL